MNGLNAPLVLGIAGHRPAILLLDDAHNGQTRVSPRVVVARSFLPYAGEHAVMHGGRHHRRLAGSDDYTAVAMIGRSQHDEARLQHRLIEAAEDELKCLGVLWNAAIAGEMDHVLDVDRIARLQCGIRFTLPYRSRRAVSMKDAEGEHLRALRDACQKGVVFRS